MNYTLLRMLYYPPVPRRPFHAKLATTSVTATGIAQHTRQLQMDNNSRRNYNNTVAACIRWLALAPAHVELNTRCIFYQRTFEIRS